MIINKAIRIGPLIIGLRNGDLLIGSNNKQLIISKKILVFPIILLIIFTGYSNRQNISYVYSKITSFNVVKFVKGEEDTKIKENPKSVVFNKLDKKQLKVVKKVTKTKKTESTNNSSSNNGSNTTSSNVIKNTKPKKKTNTSKPKPKPKPAPAFPGGVYPTRESAQAALNNYRAAGGTGGYILPVEYNGKTKYKLTK